MREPRTISIDFTGCKTGYEMHSRLQKALGLPDWYGKNWDAFWDSFRDIDNNINLEIHGLNELSANMTWNRNTLLTILQENKDDCEEFSRRFPERAYRFSYHIID